MQTEMTSSVAGSEPVYTEALESSSELTTEIMATAPGQFRVIRRNGKATSFDPNKVAIALTKAFLAVEGGGGAASARIRDTVQQLTAQVAESMTRRQPGGGTLHIEDIQDKVELALMRGGQHKVARAYVLYREQRAREREQARAAETQTQAAPPVINVTLADGSQRVLNTARLCKVVSEACQGLSGVAEQAIIDDTLRDLFDGVSEPDVGRALVMSARAKIEQEPNYTYVAARLLLDNLRHEALSFVARNESAATHSEMGELYSGYFQGYLQRGVELELLDPRLQQFNLTHLGQAMVPERDMQFTYLGLQTLYDRYFLHSNSTRFELPQAFFMRVAMGLAINEVDREARAIEFYNLLSSFDFMSSTPTLFNAGTLRPQLSSCYLTTVPDHLEGIYGAIRDNALLSKYAGGLGNDWTQVRAMGAHIKGTNGKSQGVVPFLKVANDTAVAVNQGGKRKGAVCAYLETWHLDIEEFLDLRKNTGDERRRTHDMNTANWIPDLFMKRVHDNAEWMLFSPSEVTDLHDLYGRAFEEAYVRYEEKAQRGEMKVFKRIPAVSLWRKMLGMVFETGHPWMTFKDPCNLRSPQQHVGVVHSSNLCTEITLNTSDTEIAVCNLGSINLPAHVVADSMGGGNNNHVGLDLDKLQRTVRTAMRMLDNVIDINYYSVPQARKSNLLHRPVGLGLMGFQDALYQLRLPYASDAAVAFADASMEAISYYAILASTELAAERGSYASYKGSLWSQGILPIDSIQRLAEQRGGYMEMDREPSAALALDWQALRQRVVSQGMRNSNCMAIAPTATISNICGITQSIEPTYQHLFVKSNLSGEFTVVNPCLVHDLKQRGLWDEVMANDLKYFNGSVQSIDRIPGELKALYATAFEIEPKWLIEAASRRQKWIDQGQSLNLYLAQPSGKKLDETYKFAWLRGLKTTYYLRTLGATHAEKSTITDGALNAVQEGTNAAGGTTVGKEEGELRREQRPRVAAAATGASGNPAMAAIASGVSLPGICAIDNPECEACQ